MSNENLSAPVAAVHPVTRSFHGREFVDNYEWLRDKESQETLDYLNAENDYTKAKTAHLDEMTENIFQEIKSRIKQTICLCLLAAAITGTTAALRKGRATVIPAAFQ